MSSSHTVKANPTAAKQLAAIHLKFRQMGRMHIVAQADYKIQRALEANPQGGTPTGTGNWWAVTVYPLRAYYTIQGDDVSIVKYEEAPPSIVPTP